MASILRRSAARFTTLLDFRPLQGSGGSGMPTLAAGNGSPAGGDSLAFRRGALQFRNLTVGVAISGGVDSAVAALLIKQQGHEVFGIFMRNWDEAEESGYSNCSVEADLGDAARVCRDLCIPLHTADFVSNYWNQVFLDFLEKCRRGLTPNPDLPCNRHIKFDALLRTAQALGADKVATGHYARLKTADDGSTLLLRGVDSEKDQSYFLASVQPHALDDIIFPLGDLTKVRVRQLAQEAGLHNAQRKSSAGICFIGRRRFGDFLAEYSEPLPGRYVDVDSGSEIGHCHNMAAVTHGQRASIGGNPDRMFVVGKDIPGRRVFVALGQSHPALFSHTALLQKPHWLAGRAAQELQTRGSLTCTYKARYRQKTGECTVQNTLGGSSSGDKSKFTTLLPEDMPDIEEPTLQVFMPVAARAITPQQEFVLYDSDICLGSAPVVYPGKTLAEAEDAEESGQLRASYLC